LLEPLCVNGLIIKNKGTKEYKMGKIIVTEFVTLDGVMEAPGGEDREFGGWAIEVDRGEAGDEFKHEETMSSVALLLGRVTYEGFAEAWPKRTGEFADKFNSMPKYVVSSTLEKADWNNTKILDGDVVEEVSKLRQEIEGEIVVHGSGTLARTLLEHKLVDEIRLMVFPIILGRGERLFGEMRSSITAKLIDSRTVGDGIVILAYALNE
jgi:dihydrofolate reductase